ncbi:hypothetical protein FQN60_002240 [Etheostoma spectabile]|uniref:PDZ domain-containing protein n=1 Tax=Etheostoma spectabile TaxID=54343 RepID=A0A5J5DAQ6_9PERO|nr:hypothetical protein FQN60_002240 [Etheostoma spectabile]
MSKTLKKKKHWSTKVQECTVSWSGSGELSTVVEVRGGAELGEFPHVGHTVSEAMVCHAGRFPCSGDVLLEVNGTPVSGLTNRDTLAVIRHFREPIRLKTVKPVSIVASKSNMTCASTAAESARDFRCTVRTENRSFAGVVLWRQTSQRTQYAAPIHREEQSNRQLLIGSNLIPVQASGAAVCTQRKVEGLQEDDVSLTLCLTHRSHLHDVLPLRRLLPLTRPLICMTPHSGLTQAGSRLDISSGASTICKSVTCVISTTEFNALEVHET